MLLHDGGNVWVLDEYPSDALVKPDETSVETEFGA